MGERLGPLENVGLTSKVLDFYSGKSVLVTGHTGFKGTWLSHMLTMAGAHVTGFSLDPPTNPSLFELSQISNRIDSIIGDVRDARAVGKAFAVAKPALVFHLAAQPLVRTSYDDPVLTYETNVMGTVNVCEATRHSGTVRSLLNVTTDKVYDNREWDWGYREIDPLDGYDPYSNSKSCSELVTHSYSKCFFGDAGVAASTARAGNVIGGGDFALDRIVPDCVRAVLAGEKIVVRNPDSVRPYQHVLEPLWAYLRLAMAQYEDSSVAGSFNIGPVDGDCATTAQLVDLFVGAWGDGAAWASRQTGGPHEAGTLKLDCSKIGAMLGWRPRWRIEEAVRKTVAWTKGWAAGADVSELITAQIRQYLEADID